MRVEEELRHQRELMREGFAQKDQRHHELRQDMAARFEQVDRRFESLHQDIRELQRRMDRFLIWSFGTTAGAGGLVVTLIKFWNPQAAASGSHSAPGYSRRNADSAGRNAKAAQSTLESVAPPRMWPGRHAQFRTRLRHVLPIPRPQVRGAAVGVTASVPPQRSASPCEPLEQTGEVLGV